MNAFDPFGASAPPRYAVESDSEDSEFEDPESGAPLRLSEFKAKARAREPVVELRWTEDSSSRAESGSGTVFVLVEEAGEEWEAGLAKSPEQDGIVAVDGKQVCLCLNFALFLFLDTDRVPFCFL
jgi:hypothetical protein